jgi:NHL repeat
MAHAMLQGAKVKHRAAVLVAGLVASGCSAQGHATPDAGTSCECDAPPAPPDAASACLTARAPQPCTGAGCVAIFAGGGVQGILDGPASTAQFSFPTGVAVDAQGRVYVADSGNHRIRRIADGQVTTLAGSSPGWSDGPAATARFNVPTRVAVDAAGDVWVSDSDNQRIRRIAGGMVTTAAGTGALGTSDGPAASAELEYPEGIVAEPSGRVLFVDSTYRIRALQAGMVTTVAGSGLQGFADGPAASAQFKTWTGGLAVDAMGRIVVADTGNYRVRLVADGLVSTLAAEGFENPTGVAVAGASIYVADDTSARLGVIADGKLQPAAGTGARGCDDGPALAATFGPITDVAAGPDGRLYIADPTNHVVRVFTP